MAELTFFFDRCMGRKLPKFLRQVRPHFGVEFHDDPVHGFTETTQDDEWLAPIGKKGWVIISHDKRFHKDSLAIEAVRQHKAVVFYLDGGTFQVWDKLRIFAQAFLRIRKIAKEQRGPVIYRVTHGNRVILVQDFRDNLRARKAA